MSVKKQRGKRRTRTLQNILPSVEEFGADTNQPNTQAELMRHLRAGLRPRNPLLTWISNLGAGECYAQILRRLAAGGSSQDDRVFYCEISRTTTSPGETFCPAVGDWCNTVAPGSAFCAASPGLNSPEGFKLPPSFNPASAIALAASVMRRPVNSCITRLCAGSGAVISRFTFGESITRESGGGLCA